MLLCVDDADAKDIGPQCDNCAKVGSSFFLRQPARRMLEVIRDCVLVSETMQIAACHGSTAAIARSASVVPGPPDARYATTSRITAKAE